MFYAFKCLSLECWFCMKVIFIRLNCKWWIAMSWLCLLVGKYRIQVQEPGLTYILILQLSGTRWNSIVLIPKTILQCAGTPCSIDSQCPWSPLHPFINVILEQNYFVLYRGSSDLISKSAYNIRWINTVANLTCLGLNDAVKVTNRAKQVPCFV